MTKYKTIDTRDLNETHKVLIDNHYRQVLESHYSESTKIATVYYLIKGNDFKCRYITTALTKVLA